MRAPQLVQVNAMDAAVLNAPPRQVRCGRGCCGHYPCRAFTIASVSRGRWLAQDMTCMGPGQRNRVIIELPNVRFDPNRRSPLDDVLFAPCLHTKAKGFK